MAEEISFAKRNHLWHRYRMTPGQANLIIRILSFTCAGFLIGIAVEIIWKRSNNHCKVWCDTEWAGIAIFNDHRYRSWSMRFCEGRIEDGTGKLVPVVIRNGVMVRGHYYFPTFAHSDTARVTGKK